MVYSVLGAIGPRAAAAPVADGSHLSVKQSTTRLKLAWLASVSGTCHVELDKLPDSSITKNKRRPQIRLIESVFFVLIRIKHQNA